MVYCFINDLFRGGCIYIQSIIMGNSDLKKGKRDYNVFLHTHTVSGIVISIGLFVCFFAGAFALFREEIDSWQYNSKMPESYNTKLDYEKTLKALEEVGYALEHRDVNLRYFYKAPEAYIFVNVQAIDTSDTIIQQQVNLDSLNAIGVKKVTESYSLLVNPETFEIREWKRFEEERSLGEFLYRLHYFDQIPVLGIWIAGFVSLFFLFAIFTGIIVHWKKITSNFFTFRPMAKLKVMWTDGHTALGVIGLPFQLMYAVTGCIYGLSLLLLLPTVTLLYENDQEALFADLLPGQKQYELREGTLSERQNLNDLNTRFLASLEHNGAIENVSLQLQNFGNQNAVAHFQVNVEDQDRFYTSAATTYNLHSGAVIYSKKLDDFYYAERAFTTAGKLHFATYGGYFVRLIYFILAMITCYVIISGVMIWLNARQGKKYAHKQGFIRNVGTIYLGICMGLFPATALAFIVLKVLTVNSISPSVGYGIFGVFWLAYIVYAFFLKDFKKVSRRALWLGGIFAFLIPSVNGLCTGLWIWKAIASGADTVVLIDMSWFGIAMVTLMYLWKTRTQVKTQESDTQTQVAKS